LRSIYDETKCNFEVIVVDNASSDQSADMIKANYQQVILICNKSNLGFAVANNQGFETARGRYVLMLNPDTFIIDSAIDVMLSFMNKSPNVGAVGAQNLNPDGSIQNSCHHFPSLWSKIVQHSQLNRLFPNARWANRSNMTYWNYGEVREIDWPSGSCIMMRRQAMEQVGYFDEKYFLYMEEVDWCYRAKKQGWLIFFTPDANIVHYHGMSSRQVEETKKISKNVSKHYFASHYYYFRKHYGLAYASMIRLVDLIYGFLFYFRNIPRRSDLGRIKRIRSLSVIKYAITAKVGP
jgi:GT2 family glycosyltransferase